MSRIVLLDAGILGMVAHPRVDPEVAKWVGILLNAGIGITVPEIADYELRRNLILENLGDSVRRLDQLGDSLGYLPLTTTVMHSAAALWAEARRKGQPTAADAALDADVILAAQANALRDSGEDPVVATDNVAHLSRYTAARKWAEIVP